MTTRRGGFAYIAAIIFLVVLAGFALAVMRLSDSEQTTVNQQLLGARASQAARAGLEWELYQIKGPDAACPAAQPDLVQDTGFTVTIRCSRTLYSEGETPAGAALEKYVFQLLATACNSATCPGGNAEVANPDYVERQRSASICITKAGADCY
jgi:MSHA biogenesis protein MshP